MLMFTDAHDKVIIAAAENVCKEVDPDIGRVERYTKVVNMLTLRATRNPEEGFPYMTRGEAYEVARFYANIVLGAK